MLSWVVSVFLKTDPPDNSRLAARSWGPVMWRAYFYEQKMCTGCRLVYESTTTNSRPKYDPALLPGSLSRPSTRDLQQQQGQSEAGSCEERCGVWWNAHKIFRAWGSSAQAVWNISGWKMVLQKHKMSVGGCTQGNMYVGPHCNALWRVRKCSVMIRRLKTIPSECNQGDICIGRSQRKGSRPVCAFLINRPGLTWSKLPGSWQKWDPAKSHWEMYTFETLAVEQNVIWIKTFTTGKCGFGLGGTMIQP